MKKNFLLFFLILISFVATSQSLDTTQTLATPTPNNNWNKLDLSTRANDHFMVQYGVDGWPNLPDSINTSGFSRHFNAYLMIDKPFRSSPKFSLAFGLGIGSSNIFFSNTYINLKSNTAALPFTNVSKADHFDKYKLSTSYLEVPLEFRFVTNPAQPDKGFKIALGIKGGLLISAHTKGKNLIDSAGRSLYDKAYISKEYEKNFINNSRFALTGRIGFGHISLDGSYQISNFLKAAAGPKINPYSIGLTLSGL
jgi:Outer membrane protein beta-barrel domain